MRDMVRNRQKVWYAQLIASHEMTDDDGNYLGETDPEHTSSEIAKLNVSPATGETVTQTFGSLPEYSKVLATAREFPFTEETVFWIDRSPPALHDYKVIKVAKSLNGWLYALERV